VGSPSVDAQYSVEVRACAPLVLGHFGVRQPGVVAYGAGGDAAGGGEGGSQGEVKRWQSCPALTCRSTDPRSRTARDRRVNLCGGRREGASFRTDTGITLGRRGRIDPEQVGELLGREPSCAFMSDSIAMK
jgi:hypothetical protein